MGECTPDQFIKAMEGIHSYMGTNYKKYTTNFTNALDDLELTDPDEPTQPDPMDILHWNIGKCNSDATVRKSMNMPTFIWDYSALCTPNTPKQ